MCMDDGFVLAAVLYHQHGRVRYCTLHGNVGGIARGRAQPILLKSFVASEPIMQPGTGASLDMTGCLDVLRAAFDQAAKRCGIEPAQPSELGGAWQWVWYAPDEGDQVRQMAILAVPGLQRVQVFVVTIAYEDDRSRQAARKEYWAEDYSYQESDLQADTIADTITPKLKEAWCDLSKLPV